MVHRPERLPYWQTRPDSQREAVRSMLLAPVTSAQVEGVLVAVHSHADAFARSHLDQAKNIGPVLGAAIENLRTWTGRVAETEARALALEADQRLLQHRHELLVAAMGSAVLMESADGIIVLANPALGRLFGIEDVRGMQGLPRTRVATFMAPLFVEPETFLAGMRDMRDAHKPRFEELSLADGRVVERTAQPVLDADGRLGRLWMFQDMTSRVLATRTLAAALGDMERIDEQRQQMLGQISHEIRSPIQSILAMTEALREADLPPEQSDLVHAVRGASSQVTHMLTELLDLSRLEAGTLRMETKTVDLGEIVEEVVETFGTRAAGRGLWLRVGVSSELGPVATDPDRMRQVVTNLVVNALKYTPTGGVTIWVDQLDGRPRIRVIDTGPGMTAEQQALLFQAYSQVRGSTSPERGVGLGLYISHRLVSRLRGTLTVEAPLGVGSTFTVTLPQEARTNHAPEPRPERLRPVGFGPAMLSILRTQMQAMGLDVDTTDTPTHLLLPATASPPDETVHPGSEVALIAAIQAREPRPAWADTVLRGPITRSALSRALERGRPAASTPDRAAETLGTDPAGRPVLEVIIADDDNAIRRLLQYFLMQIKPTPEIRFAETGARAVAHYTSHRADVVLLDSEMPVMDGSTAARQIRALEDTHPESPPALLVALTGHEDPQILKALADAGVDRVYTKPISPRVLLKLLQDHQDGKL